MQNVNTPHAPGRREEAILAFVFLLAIAAAFYFRFVGLNWDQDQHLHPDERFLTMVETAIAPVKGLGEFFDSAQSSLNPVNRGYGFFVYGTLPIFIVRYVGAALQQTNYEQITIVGRQLSALADLGALLFLFVLARRLYSNRVAVLAAVLSAAAVLPIQQAHFFAVDTFANFFVVAAFFFIVRAAREGTWFDFAASGLAVGMAVSCKANVWPVAGFVALAAVMNWSRDERTRSQPEAAILKLMLAGLVAALAFRVFQPYAFAGPRIWNVGLEPRWRANMTEVQRLVNGDQDVPYGDQWTDRAPIIFPWTNMVVWGMGLPLGLAAWIGWAWVGWEIVSRKRWREHLLPWLWATAFFVYQGAQWVKSMRYILPVYPFFILFAAYWLSNFRFRIPALRAGARISSFTLGKKTAAILTTLVVVGTLAWAWGFTRIYTRPVTRITASRWIYDNVPTAATLHYSASSEEHVLQFPLPNAVTYNISQPATIPFRVPVTATVESITMNYLADPKMDPAPETFQVTVADDPFGNTALARAEVTANFAEGGDARGKPYTFNLSPAVLYPGRDYWFSSAVVANGPVVANTSYIGNEHWDDGLPVRLDGKDGFSIYKGVEIQNYAEDEPSKLPLMISWLTQADYLVLSSNRLYGSIPRLPLRYPMTSEYYRALFDGRLGFDKVAEFSSYVNLGPFWFPDQESTEMLGMPNPFDQLPGRINIPLPPAEEAFSVYDHPRVVIFHKSKDFSPEKVTLVLAQYDLSQAVRLWPKQATAAPTALMLDQEVWRAQQVSGTWSELYNRDSLLNRFPALAIVAVWLLVAVMGALAWPVITFAWPDLPDLGWGLARILGLLIVAYLAWLAASLRVLTFARGTLLAATLTLAILGGLIAAKRRHELVSFLRQSQPLILAEEAMFAIVFLIFLLIRYGNGDLWHFYLGGERPMDFAYLNAILKTNYFPPYDPWFAAGQMNYYYFGFVLVSVPIKLLGIVPALAYNLVLPMLAALTALGAFSVAFNLFRISDSRFRYASRGQTPTAIPAHALRSGTVAGVPDYKSAIWVGVLAALLVVIVGNLGELHLIYTKLGELGASQFRSTIPGLAGLVSATRGLILMLSGKPLAMNVEWWYWNASRIMTNGEINEFPFFTFLYSDLHAHMIAFPLTVLMLGIALGWALRRQWRSIDALVGVVIGAIVVGVARANNSWDYPTYLVLALFALFISGLQVHCKRQASSLQAVISGAVSLGLFGAAWVLGGINDVPTFIGLAAIVFVAGQLLHQVVDQASEWRWIDLAVIGVMGLSILYFRPYIASYATAYSSVELWNGPRSPIQAYLLIHGIFLFPILAYLLVQLRRMSWRWFAAALNVNDVWWVWVLFAFVIATVVVATLALIGYSVIVIAAPLMALALLILAQRHLDTARRFIVLGTLLALALTLAVEVIVLKGDIGRMNTIFKFYLQVWIILGIASAVMIGWTAQQMRHWTDTWQTLWTVAVVGLIASGLLYPILATRAKINDRFDVKLGPTLDAMEFMTVARANEQGQEYSFADEYAALIWMQDNIQGTPVVAESAAAPEYRSLRNRVPMYTGLPSIIGYNYHQKQQRSILPSDTIDRRVSDVNLLFTTIDANQAASLIQRYDVGYVIVGYPERLYYLAQGLAKFDQMVTAGRLRVAYKNEHVTLYQVVR